MKKIRLKYYRNIFRHRPLSRCYWCNGKIKSDFQQHMKSCKGRRLHLKWSSYKSELPSRREIKKFLNKTAKIRALKYLNTKGRH